MAGLSPDDYRRAAGYRRSEAGVSARPHASWAYEPNPLSEGYVFEDLTDPRLAAFLAGGRTSAAGIRVNEALALRNSTYFRAVSLITGSIGMLPVHLMRRLDDDKTEEARDNKLFSVLKNKPNDFQTPLEFKTFMQFCALQDGNAYARIVKSRGQIIALNPLKRGTVTAKLGDDFKLSFTYNRPGGGQVEIDPADLFHFRSIMSCDGVHGISLLDVATETLGIAKQAERAVARLMRNGTMVGGALETSNSLGEEAIERLQKSLAERHEGAENAGKWMVLEEGLTAKQLAHSAVDNELTETRRLEAEEMARFTGAPRPLLMFDETSWGSGIEQLGQFFVTYCLGPWFVAWEQAIERALPESNKGELFPKFNEGALLRGSLKDQAEFFAKALGSGGSQAWMTADEVRGNFDLNKIEGGDKLPARIASKGGSDPAKEAT